MNDPKLNQSIEEGKVMNPDDFLNQETETTEQSETEPTYEQRAENELAHEQNISAFVPGGTTIADVDK